MGERFCFGPASNLGWGAESGQELPVAVSQSRRLAHHPNRCLGQVAWSTGLAAGDA
jgi:hypothetical protein